MSKKSMRDEFAKGFMHLASTYSPNNEYGFVSEISGRGRHIERVDLREIPAGSVVHVVERHPSAVYWLRVNDTDEGRKVNIWGDNRNGLVGPVESVVSYEQGLTNIQRGVIVKDSALVMPYFEFRDGSVQKPWTVWIDSPIRILLKIKE